MTLMGERINIEGCHLKAERKAVNDAELEIG